MPLLPGPPMRLPVGMGSEGRGAPVDVSDVIDAGAWTQWH